jgi:hypothetical protein
MPLENNAYIERCRRCLYFGACVKTKVLAKYCFDFKPDDYLELRPKAKKQLRQHSIEEEGIYFEEED